MFYRMNYFFKATCMLLLLLPACFPGGKKSGLYVINVLDKEHHTDCHIKDSVNVELDALENFVKDLDKDTAELVIYCSNYMCTASGFAAQQLKEMGFKHVWAYEAGMAEWYQKGLPVEGPCKKGYLEKIIEKPGLDQKEDIGIISTDELARKMKL